MAVNIYINWNLPCVRLRLSRWDTLINPVDGHLDHKSYLLSAPTTLAKWQDPKLDRWVFHFGYFRPIIVLPLIT